MCPKLVVFGFIVGAVGGFIDGYRKIKQPPQRTTMTPKKMPDYHAQNMGDLYIVSYDPDLYYNPNAETLEVDLKESIVNMDAKPTIRSLDCKIKEAERFISKCLLEKAEEKLLESQQWILSTTSDSDETPKEDFPSTLSKLEEYLAKIKNIIDIKVKVDQLIEEVDEDMRNQDVKDAHAKIVECPLESLCRHGNSGFLGGYSVFYSI